MISMSEILSRAQDMIGIGTVRDDAVARRHQQMFGVLAMVVVVIVAVALGVTYLRPIGYAQYTAHLSNASGVRTGDQVRIAGIQVGKVNALTIDGDHIRMAFSVKHGVFVGRESSLAVKLLTPVGGRYVALTPKGTTGLGDTPIPPDRVTGTYDISSLLEDATPKAAQLDGNALHSLIDTIETGMAGQPTAMSHILDTASSLTSSLAQRSQGLQVALRVSDEYVAATAADRKILFTLVANLGKIGIEIGLRHEQVYRTFNLLKRLFLFLERPVIAYSQSLQRPVDDLADILDRLQPRMNEVDRSFQAFTQAFDSVKQMIGDQGIEIDQSNKVITGVKLCVPSAGRNC